MSKNAMLYQSIARRMDRASHVLVRRVLAIVLKVVLTGLFVLALMHVSAARADSASCLAKAASFVAELDELLEKEQEWDTPYPNLVKRYFPLRDCEAGALLDVVRQSRFIRSIQHNPRTNEYHVLFERDVWGAWFSYLVAERKSTTADAGLLRKP
jgi:hypothetical protein